MPKINRYWNSDPDSLVERERPETYDLCKSCECVNQLLWKEKMLKRALWLARAARSDDRARMFYFAGSELILDIEGYSYDPKKKKEPKKLTARLWRIVWLKVERKCREKAEEYK